MLLLSRVCAEFRDRTGAVLFAVTPETRLTFQEAPESIRQDPLFGMLLNDHSIEVTEDKNKRKAVENDPVAPLPEVPEKPEKPEPADKPVKPARAPEKKA